MNNSNYKKLLALAMRVGDNVQIITNKKQESISVRFFVEDNIFLSIGYYPKLEDKFMVRAGKQSQSYFSPTPYHKLLDYMFPGVRKKDELYILVDFDEINTSIMKLPKYITEHTVYSAPDAKYRMSYPKSLGEMFW